MSNFIELAEQLDEVANDCWRATRMNPQARICEKVADALRALAAPAVANGAAEREELPPLPEPLELDWPELHSQALGCGVEDRNIHNRYEAAEYGWQDGVDKTMERVPDAIYDAAQMRDYARAAIASTQQAAPKQALSDIDALMLLESFHLHLDSGTKLAIVRAVEAAAAPNALLVAALHKNAIQAVQNWVHAEYKSTKSLGRGGPSHEEELSRAERKARDSIAALASVSKAQEET